MRFSEVQGTVLRSPPWAWSSMGKTRCIGVLDRIDMPFEAQMDRALRIDLGRGLQVPVKRLTKGLVIHWIAAQVREGSP